MKIDPTPSPADLEPVEYSDRLMRAIACIILICSNLDDMISRRLFALLKVDHIEGFTMIGQMGPGKKMGLLTTLTKKNAPEDIETTERIKPLLSGIFGVRNHLAHGMIIGRLKSSKGIVILMHGTIRENGSVFMHQAKSWTEDQLVITAHSVSAIFNELLDKWKLPLSVGFSPDLLRQELRQIPPERPEKAGDEQQPQSSPQ